MDQSGQQTFPTKQGRGDGATSIDNGNGTLQQCCVGGCPCQSYTVKTGYWWWKTADFPHGAPPMTLLGKACIRVPQGQKTSKHTVRGYRLAKVQSKGFNFGLVDGSGTLAPLLTSAASCPNGIRSHHAAPAGFTCSHSQTVSLKIISSHLEDALHQKRCRKSNIFGGGGGGWIGCTVQTYMRKCRKWRSVAGSVAVFAKGKPH